VSTPFWLLCNTPAQRHPRALETQDDFVQLKAAQILTVFLSSEPKVIPPQYLQPFLQTLAGFVQGNVPHKRDVAVQCLEALLPKAECRRAVWGIGGIIAGCARDAALHPAPLLNDKPSGSDSSRF
jgi:V-type H+-transporting ATPase subunit H